MTARLKVDEDLPREIAELLNTHGYDAVTVRDQGWTGSADDDLWQRIQKEGRWLVTADKGLPTSACIHRAHTPACFCCEPMKRVWRSILSLLLKRLNALPLKSSAVPLS